MTVRPNVLIVVMDTARADAFEPYGALPGSTPAVAALARAGGAAPVVHATANWTLPSHASLFSGRLPRALGIGSGAPLRHVLAANEQRLLAPVLHDEGWHTVGVSANPFVSPVHGFGLGFDRYFDVTSARAAPRPGVLGRAEDALDAVLADVDDGLARVEETLDAAIDDAPSDRPWFAFVNLMECHAPYLPPRPWNDLGGLGRLRAATDVRRHQSHAAVVDACLGRHEVPATSVRRMRRLYGRAVSMMDAWLGRMHERLADRGQLGDTLIVVTSDHGENIGECGRLGHTLSVDERLLRVPLVAAGPGIDDTGLDGAGPDGLRSLADVPRFVASAIGLERHPWKRPACPDGIALAQNDGYSAVDPAFARIFASEWQLDHEAIARLDQPMVAAIGARFKLVRDELGDRVDERLHDLDADPLEVRDVSAEHPDEVARLGEALAQADRDRPSASSVPSTAARAAHRSGDDDELVGQLRTLGYL